MEQNEAKWFSELRHELTEYVDLKVEVIRLTIYEKVSKLAAALTTVIVIIFLSSLFFFFVFLAAAYWIGDLVNNRGLGFLIVAGFYLLLLLIYLMIRKGFIEKTIINKVIEILTENDHEETNQ